MKNSFSIVLLLLLLLSCKHKTIINQTNLKDLGLINYLAPEQVNSLDRCLQIFDVYLEENYKNTPKENQILLFLNDIDRSYTSKRIDTLSHFVSTFDVFLNSISSLETTGFFTKLNNKRIKNIEEWRLNLLKSKFELDNQHVDMEDMIINLYRFENNNVGLDFYHGMYQIVSLEDSITKKWIEAKVSFHPTTSALYYLKNKAPTNYLNSAICKTLIFTEFILPFYSFEDNFSFENFLNEEVKKHFELYR